MNHTAAAACPAMGSAAPARPEEFALLSFQGKRANEIWTKSEFTALSEHLHNNNGDTHWVMGFRKNGIVEYKRAKRKSAWRSISWAWSTIIGKVKPGYELAFAPYSSNANGQSRWGAMDFDAHDRFLDSQGETIAYIAPIENWPCMDVEGLRRQLADARILVQEGPETFEDFVRGCRPR